MCVYARQPTLMGRVPAVLRTWRHKPGQSRIGGILPTHRPFIHPTPVVTCTFSSNVQFEICINIISSVLHTSTRARREC